MSITKETIAAALHGIEYDGTHCHPIAEQAKLAKEAGLLIVWGESDDLVEFDGAFTDEVGAYSGTTVYLDRKGVLDRNQCESDEQIADFTVRTIVAVWGEGDISWQYRTDIPHVTFDVMEDGDVYCRGLVIDISDLPEPDAGKVRE